MSVPMVVVDDPWRRIEDKELTPGRWEHVPLVAGGAPDPVVEGVKSGWRAEVVLPVRVRHG